MKAFIFVLLCIFAVVFVAGLLKGGKREGGAQVLWFLKFIIGAIVVTIIAVAAVN